MKSQIAALALLFSLSSAITLDIQGDPPRPIEETLTFDLADTDGGDYVEKNEYVYFMTSGLIDKEARIREEIEEWRSWNPDGPDGGLDKEYYVEDQLNTLYASLYDVEETLAIETKKTKKNYRNVDADRNKRVNIFEWLDAGLDITE